ncbi:chemotaxis protein CheA [Bacillus cereus group sp. TH152-1LC]|uniref:chemotaxis protein CheA n=1 Tax=Bacillus cereus group sp. TH152-1LC TaxID=3018060 RepID=UPI0022E2125E|nr:chemotaxis protein CheA [Bacillus cereus group sp. TH152-1LC]MDA1674926.1 chemotaxis protein CheA [Bacillus cereus group sp. TH152-1LC]
MELNELINLFLYELEEELEEYSTTFFEIEKEANISLLDDLYINVHTIKGSSKSLLNNLNKEDNHVCKNHVEKIALITHTFEDYLEILKQKEELFEADVSILLEFDTLIRELKDYIENESTETMEEEKIDIFFSNLKSHNEEDEANLKNLSKRHFFNITLISDEDYKHGYLTIVYREIEQTYPDSFFIPSKDDLLKNKDFDLITIQINSEHEQDKIRDFILNLDNVGEVTNIPYNNRVVSSAPKDYQTKSIKEFIDSNKNEPNKSSRKRTKSQPLRISTRRIDNVLKHTSKLVILKNKLDQFLIQNDFLTGTKKRKELEELFNEINSHVDYLQESVLEIRMTSFEQLFNRFPKDIRELSKEYNKPIKLNTIGGNTEIDKSILDELFDPFMHIIRNSVIHGIESPEHRIQKGKNPEGTITVQAKHDKNRVIITISDDGKGINLETLKQVAINKNIVSPSLANNMNKQDLLELIFKSGVSTSEKVTEYSGRGIGMDAVRKKIDAINGSISVSSIDDVGTNITLFLPLTTAIIEGMITKVNNEYFTFPISQVEEVINIKKTEVRTSSDKKYFFLKDKEIPIIYAEEFFGMQLREKDDNPFFKIMILRSHNYIVGLTIDEFLGQQSIVVKSMHPFVQGAKGISSCNILGDGSISLIVDSNDLLYHLNHN